MRIIQGRNVLVEVISGVLQMARIQVPGSRGEMYWVWGDYGIQVTMDPGTPDPRGETYWLRWTG